MANFGTFVMRPKEDTARDKLIPRKLVRQSRGDTKDEDVICHHSAHCRQILSIKTPLSSPSNSRIIWHVAAVACVCVKRMRFVYVCVTSDRTISNMVTWPLRPRHDVNLLRGGRVLAPASPKRSSCKDFYEQKLAVPWSIFHDMPTGCWQ